MGSVDADLISRRRPPAIPTIVGVAAGTVLVDQLTKWWAVVALDDGHIIDLFWTFRFRLVFNFGTAFSLTDRSGPLVSVLAIAVVVFLLRSGRTMRSAPVLWSYGLIVGGTVGNVVDRAFRRGEGLMGGGVVDFVDAQWFPVFNVADAALVIGIALVVVVSWVRPEVFERPEPAARPTDSPTGAPGPEPADPIDPGAS